MCSTGRILYEYISSRDGGVQVVKFNFVQSQFFFPPRIIIMYRCRVLRNNIIYEYVYAVRNSNVIILNRLFSNRTVCRNVIYKIILLPPRYNSGRYAYRCSVIPRYEYLYNNNNGSKKNKKNK